MFDGCIMQDNAIQKVMFHSIHSHPGFADHDRFIYTLLSL